MKATDLLAGLGLLLVGVVYTGFGFLMKGVVDDPYSAIPSTAIAGLVQYAMLTRFVGRLKRRAKGKKEGKAVWTKKALIGRYIPLIFSTSLLAGIAGNVGRNAVLHLGVPNPLLRQLLKYTAICLAGLAPAKLLRDNVERECLPRERVLAAPPPAARSEAGKPVKSEKAHAD